MSDRKIAESSAALPDAASTTRVLLVDDQAIVAEAIRRMLATEENLEYHYCADPARAIAEAVEFQPTVILQDLVMPDIDGMMLLRFFRANPVTKNIPIIVMSSKEDPKIKSEAFELQASDYLVKIPDKIELIARVRAHTRSYLAQQQRDEAYRALRDLQIELEKKNKELQRLSSLGGLTGVAHRRRYGGEEFVIILPESDPVGAASVAVASRQVVERLNIPHGFSSAADHVTISMGVASVFPREGGLPATLIESADGALYEAKHAGRNRYVSAHDVKKPEARKKKKEKEKAVKAGADGDAKDQPKGKVTPAS